MLITSSIIKTYPFLNDDSGRGLSNDTIKLFIHFRDCGIGEVLIGDNICYRCP